ncbi:hypothetical protein TNCV_3361511 [Trichonephila clavipes]|nr:hypothetical protein TNCV_3361511 [Trichonephila clavipes]
MHLKSSTSKKGRAEEADSVILETASTQDTIENAFEGLDDFFTSLNPENIDSSTSALRDINSESPPLAPMDPSSLNLFKKMSVFPAMI